MSDELSVSVAIPPELIEQLVELVAARVLERLAEPAGTNWMTVAQAAAHLGLSAESLYKRIPSLPHRKLGGRILFDRDELDEWLEGFREGPRVSRPRRKLRSVAP